MEIATMKGELINCSTHKDIYFLETNTKSESTNLANLFAPPTDRDLLKYKTRPKLKHKFNPALEFFIQSQSSLTTLDETTSNKSRCQGDNKCASSSSTGRPEDSGRRKSSIDLYEEAASILGLTCAQTDDCKCLECQCHYFDFEEDIDFSSSTESLMDQTSSCCIQ